MILEYLENVCINSKIIGLNGVNFYLNNNFYSLDNCINIKAIDYEFNVSIDNLMIINEIGIRPVNFNEIYELVKRFIIFNYQNIIEFISYIEDGEGFMKKIKSF